MTAPTSARVTRKKWGLKISMNGLLAATDDVVKSPS
jgi:hypothetical protein